MKMIKLMTPAERKKYCSLLEFPVSNLLLDTPFDELENKLKQENKHAGKGH